MVKQPGDFSQEEVCLWLVAIGLGDKQDVFKENALDGDMLVNLSQEDYQTELGLTKLQAMKVMRSIETSKELAGQGGGDGGGGADADTVVALEAKIAELQNENVALKAQLDELIAARHASVQAPAPAPPPAPAPAPAPPPPKRHGGGAPVIKGAAGGAAKGAVLGAVAGAITGDPGQGAKVGAAVGATGGAMGGLGARRRQRMGRRR